MSSDQPSEATDDQPLEATDTAHETSEPVSNETSEPVVNLSLLVSSIDKLATNDDLVAHFGGKACVAGVEKYSNPKHTARINLKDEESVQKGLALNGSTLHRRVIVVEPWDGKIFENMSSLERKFAIDRQSEGSQRPRLSLKPRSKPLPELSIHQPDDLQSEMPRQRVDRNVGAPMQRADCDLDWRSRSTTPQSASLWDMVQSWCCKRRLAE